MLKNKMKKNKGLVGGIAIGLIAGLLAVPAVQFAVADVPDVEPTKKVVQTVSSEKGKIEKEEDNLDIKEDQLEDEYKKGNITRDEYIKQDKVLEQKEEELDRKEDLLEMDYENGKISREEFLRQESLLEAEEDKLDAQEDRLERLAGFDDDDDEEWDD